jgi:hypothetical protein
MISASLLDLDTLDIEGLKALVMAQHSELLEHRSNAQEIDRLKLIIERGVADVYRIGSALCVGSPPFLEQLVTGQYRPEW